MRITKWVPLFVLFLVLVVPTATTSSNTSVLTTSPIGVDQTEISDVDLQLSSNEVEFGGVIEVNFGVLSSNSSYIANITSELLVFHGIVEVTTDLIGSDNYTVLFVGNTSDTPSVSLFDTLPANADPFSPGNYTMYFGTTGTYSGYNTSTTLEVFPNEGANLDVSFSEIGSNQKITEPVNLEINATKYYQITITNSGTGNALDVFLDRENINGPLQVDTSKLPYSTPVIRNLTQVKVNFSITVPDFGLSEIQFTLTYNKTTGATITESPAIEFRALPDIRGQFINPSTVLAGRNIEINVQITNYENRSFRGTFFLSSASFSFQPAETRILNITAGETIITFNGITYSNGSINVDLFMTFIDPLGNDEYDMNLDTIEIQVEGQPGRLDTLTVVVLVLYVLLFIGIILVLLSKRVRAFILNNLISRNFIPDIDFEKKKIVIDGSNVAWEELSENGKPMIKNIILAVDRLKEYGFEEILVVADAALRYQIEDPKDLDSQSRAGNIKVLPAKVDGDSFILRLSRDIGSLILTNDLYKEYRDEFGWVDDRRVPYTILDGKLYLHPIYDLD